MNILYIILKHAVWRFRIYNYFREISKFRDFMNTLTNFVKYVFAHIFAKFEYTYCEGRARKVDVRALEYGNVAGFQDSG